MKLMATLIAIGVLTLIGVNLIRDLCQPKSYLQVEVLKNRMNHEIFDEFGNFNPDDLNRRMLPSSGNSATSTRLER